jgi:beta-mannanase
LSVLAKPIALLAAAVVAGLLWAAPASAGPPPVLFGMYTDGQFFPGQSGVAEAHAVDAWIGNQSKSMSILATSKDWEWPNPDANVPIELDTIWNAGYVPWVNWAVGAVTPTRTSAQIAAGAIDAEITGSAVAFRNWAAAGGKRAFIAVLQEMNGYWVPYGQDPVGFKAAYQRIRDIFAAQGVTADMVRWVFSPNGFALPGDEFEKYYPGSATVDVVAVSAYNFGSCTIPPHWDTFELGFKPYLDRLAALAPGKPIIQAQTASVSQGGDKNLWLNDTFTKLAAYPGLRAILYFNRKGFEGLPSCADPIFWYFYGPGGTPQFTGARDALLNTANGFGHWAANDPNWVNVAFASLPPHTFDDVVPTHPWSGVPSVFYFDSVETLVASGVTGGCTVTPPLYCPDSPVTREQMAVFLLKAQYGAGYSPPPCTAPPFADVPCSSQFATWIQDLVTRGITSGCGAGVYCPSSQVTREQMAVFLLKTLLGAGYTPPPCSSPSFADVPCSSSFAPWIYDLVARGVTAGCGGVNYCPTDPVTRGQMAVFLVNNFGL